jgi:hypothetical protein
MHQRILPAHFCISLINKFQPTTQHNTKSKINTHCETQSVTIVQTK